MHLSLPYLVVALCAAYGLGLSKTGIAGVGIVSVAMLSAVMPGRPSVGVVLPLLICADTIAVCTYRRNAVWSHLRQLFPWAAVGIVLGWKAMGHINDNQVAHLVGALLLLLSGIQIGQRLHVRRRKRLHAEKLPVTTDGTDVETEEVGLLASGGLATIALGILAGFATMIANAAGPLMILYLLAARLPKVEFVGTGAWYFFCLNLFKLPFSIHLGLITPNTLHTDLWLLPFVIAGCLTGRPLLRHINQKRFENLALFFTTLAAIKLLLGPR